MAVHSQVMSEKVYFPCLKTLSWHSSLFFEQKNKVASTPNRPVIAYGSLQN